MPRYFFNVHDDQGLRDGEGTDLGSLDDARLEAVRLAGVIFQEQPKRIGLDRDWHMEVTDGVGLVLLRLDFFVSDTAATRRSGNIHQGSKAP